uniref:Transthyretin-like family protein n=1 Tax=Rhabditophanes sp. KR3021 TaxID=114890 RepID=A0AC35TIY2_9BILA
MDDLMAQTKTDKYGKFSLYGCAIDPFEGNDPDPYLKIVHKCTHDKKKVKMEIGLVPIFTANYQNIGKIELEDTRQSNKN